MKRTVLAGIFFFALPLIASAQSYYYPPSYGYGMQQQQQQQQGGYGYYQPQYYQPQYYQPYYQPQPQYYQPSYQQPSYVYQPSSYYQPQYYGVGQQVPNYSSFGNTYGMTYSAYASPGAYNGTPNPYLDSGYFTGNYDAFQSPICYFPSYGSADCGSDPRQPVYDVWSGTYY